MKTKQSFEMMMVLTLLGLTVAVQAQAQATRNAISAIKSAPQAESQAVSSSSALIPALPVPRLVKYSGLVKDVKGQPLTGIVGLTFSVYAEQEGGSALWMETQNAELDRQGRYTVLLGSTKSEGVPLDLFASGEPRWLGVKVELQGEVEQSRVLLVSVPYALKASDADTLGGKPLSSFVLQQGETTTTGSGTTASSTISSPGSKNVKPAASGNAETANYLAMFTNSSGTLANSAIYQNSSGNIGIGYTSPNARLVIGAPAGGAVLNSSNLADQDMFVTLSAPGASDKHAFFGPSTNTNLTLGVGNTEMMRITNTGNVGIGYSNPTNARLVIGAPKGGGVLNASNLADQDMFVSLSAPGAADKHAFFGPSTNTSLTLGVGGTEMMRINSSGQVGIGTSTPGAMLEVNGPSKFDGTVTFTSGQTFSGMATLGSNTFTGNQTVNGALSATVPSGTAVIGTTTSSSGYGVYGSNDSNGAGINGYSYQGVGVQGVSSSWLGVYGQTGGTSEGSAAVFGMANTSSNNNVYGVYGNDINTNRGAGVYGQLSTTGTRSHAGQVFAIGAGVWGDGGAIQTQNNSQSNMGVLGTTDNEIAVYARNNSSTYAPLWAYNVSSGGDVFGAYNALGHGCAIDNLGNINCTGSKNAVVSIDGGQRKVALSAIESPKNWFEDFGSAQLTSGSAVVAIEPDYRQTVNTEAEYHVFLTPNGDCKGLYISRRTPDSFEVRELNGGGSNIEFSYRIVALRKNFETIRMADHTHDLDAVERMMAKTGTTSKADTSKTNEPERRVMPILHPTDQTGKPTQNK